MPNDAPSRPERTQRLGHTAGVGLFGLLVGGAAALWTVQIIVQVFFEDPVAAGTSTCRDGVAMLIRELRQARDHAVREPGEAAALSRFRTELAPTWQQRAAVWERCQSDAEAKRVLVEVERLRYAEESSLRWESRELLPRREKIRRLEAAMRLETTPGPH